MFWSSVGGTILFLIPFSNMEISLHSETLQNLMAYNNKILIFAHGKNTNRIRVYSEKEVSLWPCTWLTQTLIPWVYMLRTLLFIFSQLLSLLLLGQLFPSSIMQKEYLMEFFRNADSFFFRYSVALGEFKEFWGQVVLGLTYCFRK